MTLLIETTPEDEVLPRHEAQKRALSREAAPREVFRALEDRLR